MHMKHPSVVPTQPPWVLLGGLLLSLAFIFAFTLMLLQWFKHPGQFEQRYRPLEQRDDTTQPSEPDRVIDVEPE
jgi:hypothetical protein